MVEIEETVKKVELNRVVFDVELVDCGVGDGVEFDWGVVSKEVVNSEELVDGFVVNVKLVVIREDCGDFVVVNVNIVEDAEIVEKKFVFEEFRFVVNLLEYKTSVVGIGWVCVVESSIGINVIQPCTLIVIFVCSFTSIRSFIAIFMYPIGIVGVIFFTFSIILLIFCMVNINSFPYSSREI